MSIEGIIEEQYYLSKKANISFEESNNMPLFEKIMILGMLIRDLKEEAKAYKK